MLLGRSRILARTARAESHLISIVAPAGFGKTTIATAIAEARGPFAICDVEGVTDLHAFAQRVIRIVSHFVPERADALANDLFRHSQSTVTGAQLAGFVLDAWVLVDERNICIFDNLEALTEQPESLDLLVRLIKAADRRMLILCARPPFALLNSRLIPPNEHLRFTIEDLAFTRDEAFKALDAAVDEAQLDAVMALTHGWPVAVMLFRQIVRLGQLDRTLNATRGWPPDDLRDYLLKEVLESLRGPLLDALIALIATASIGLDAALRATDGATTSLVVLELSARLPLVRFNNGGYTIHPLISAIVSMTAATEMERYGRAAAASYERDGLYANAARLYLDYGLVEAAARSLESMVGPYIERNAWADLDELVEQLPGELLPNYPRLWAMLAWVRRGVVDIDVLIAEGMTLRERLRSDLRSLEAMQVNALLLSFLSVRCDHASAKHILADYELDEADLSPGNIALLISDAFYKAVTGHLNGALDRYHRLTPLLHNELVRAYYILRVDVLIKTQTGRFAEALLSQRHAQQLAKSSDRNGLIAGLAQQELFVTWLSGDDAGVEAIIGEMRRSGGTIGSVDYAGIADAWESDDADGLADRLPRVRAFLFLMLAGESTTPERRHSLLERADESSRQAHDLWSRLLIVVAGALGDVAGRAESLAFAAELGREIGVLELVESIASLQAGGDGGPTLRAFARRFAVASEPRAAASAVRVSALSRTVWRGTERLRISRRALTLITILAVQGRVPAETLVDWLWRERDPDLQTNALNMLVSRARRQLGDPRLIVATGGGYELHPDVAVDFHEISQLTWSLPPNDPLSDAQRTALRAAHEQFRHAWAFQETVPSIDAAVSATRHRVVERLANDALDRGDIADALTLADELRRHDSSDEAAYELLIRAHVRSGDQASAMREYRRYSLHLKDDLGLEPSFSIDELLQA